MKKIHILLSILPFISFGQSQNLNYTKSKIYKVPTLDVIPAPDAEQAITTMKYYDGLGRPIQTVAHQQSTSGKDIIVHIEYDEFGRQKKEFLPYTNQTPSLNFDNNSLSNQGNYYTNSSNPNFETTNYPFSEKEFEESPLNRVLKQSSPGNDWHVNSGHTIGFEYQINMLEDEVFKFSVSRSYNPGLELYDYTLTSSGYYKNGELYKKVIKDENWTAGKNNTIEEYVDNLGRTILKRSYNNKEAFETYYVYDNVGNLIYVIPPKASDDIVEIEAQQIPYFHNQWINITDVLLQPNGNPISGGGSMFINIENSQLKVAFPANFSGLAYFDTNTLFPINSAYPIPDMVVGNLTCYCSGTDQYRVVVENSSLRFEDLTPNDPPFQFPTTMIGTCTSCFKASGDLDPIYFQYEIIQQAVLYFEDVEDLVYQYKYDSRNRLVEKKLPGKQWEYIVYDKLDRPIATGPAFSPFGGNTTGWMITKYDTFGRVAYTAWKEQSSFSTQERHSLQELINNSSLPQYESRLTQPITVNSVSLPYSNHVQPATDIIILTINYYDDYTFTAAPSPLPTEINGVEILQNVKGMPTGNWTRLLTIPSETISETSFMYYDERGRTFYSKVNNHLGGYTETYTDLDFLGVPLKTLTIHKRDTNPLVVTIVDEFEYLHNGKLKKHIQKVNNNPQELIVANTYDELGQLISKQVGGQDIQNEIGYQKIDYRYNIRGWLTHINNIEDLRENGALNDDLFAFKINYNEITEVENGDMNFVTTSFNNTVKPLFNGNIAETYWKTATDDILRKYSYSYDDLNRLRKAYFQKPYDVVSHNRSFDEYIDYDKNGNIYRLYRFADQNEYGNVIEIDALGYHYQQHSNKLMKVTDATNFSAGFGDDSDGTNDTDDDYAYDDNGNMISDQNKGIGSIKYNHLNLPTEIRFDNGGTISYLYTASGVKVGKIVYQGGNNPVQTDYLGGFQYVNGNLQFFPHPEGYVSVVKFGSETLVINYAYQYKDHLGNIRLNYGKDPETNVLKVLEENHYYPFGLKHQNYNTGRKQYGKKEDEITTLQFPGLVLPTEEKPMVYKYKYQSQEFQDELGLNIYFFKFRMSDPATGRFLNIDPLSPTYPHNSTYAFAENNVTSGTDLEGLELSFNLQGDRATAQSGPRVTGGVGGNYTLQELRSHVAQKQAEQDRILQKVMSGDHRSLPKADIHLPASDIRVAKYNNPSLMVADGVGIGAKEAVTDFAVGGILYKLGKGAQSVWKLNRFSRGRMIEDMFGADATWSKNFPTIDKIQDGVATSIKSMDLTAPSYQKGNTVLNTLKGYVDKLADFTNARWGNTIVTQGESYTSKALELAVQTGKGTDSQWDQINQAINYALEKNINVTIRFIN